MRDYDLLDDGHRRMADDTAELRQHLRDFTALYGAVVKPQLLDDIAALYGRLALQLDVLHKDHSQDAGEP